MIRNPETLKAFEDDLARHEKGIEVDIRVAKVLNSCLKRSSQK